MVVPWNIIQKQFKNFSVIIYFKVYYILYKHCTIVPPQYTFVRVLWCHAH